MEMPDMDAYGQELFAHWKGEPGVMEIIEREDGYFDAHDGPSLYFAPVESWPPHEQQAMEYVEGRVLDIGAGAGRVALYLQERGHEVVAIDNSPLAIEVCRKRGVQNVSLTPISHIGSNLGKFDTIILLGNNFGLLGSYRLAKYLLRKMGSITSPGGRIIAESTDISQTTNPDHLSYQAYNLQRGRMPGQVRIRVRFRKSVGPWFDYLLVTKGQMMDILDGTGWQVSRFIDAPQGPSYIAILEKANRKS